MVSQVMGAIGLGASIAGGALSSKGAFDQGIAQMKQNYYQAGIAELNANIAKQNEEYALNQGELQAGAYGISARERAGSIRAAQGSSGLDVATGSARDVQRSQESISRMDLDTIRMNASKVAYDYDVQSLEFQDQANLYKMAGNNQAVAGGINAEASVLGTVAGVANKWSQGSQVGLFNPTQIGSDISSTVSSISSGASALASGFSSMFG